MASNGVSRLASILGTSCALLLAACGGGGSSDDSGRSPPAVGYTVSGTVAAFSATVVDGDVNDPLAPRVSNDTFATAQPLVAPVTVGGYANQPRSGPIGASYSSGDELDVYRVSLRQGMQISLHVATEDIGANDLDLGLFDDQGELVDSSESWTSKVESITVPRDGDYYVVVYAYSGASNYTLTLGLASSVDNTSARLRLSDDFVPGEVVVKFKNSTLRSGGQETLKARAAELGLQPLGGSPGQPMLFALGDSGARARSLQSLGVTRLAKSASPNVQAKLETLRAIKALSKRSDIEYAEPNYILRPHRVPDDEGYPLQWHYPLINLPQAWDLTVGERAPSPVVVAVIDTGVLMNHPELKPLMTADGFDFISNAARARDGDGLDADPDDPGDSPVGRSSFHGTHVAGTISAMSNNGVGVAGVSWAARLMALRVLGEGGGSSHDVRQAVLYAAGLPNDSGRVPARRADIMNLSLGGSAPSQADREVYAAARNAGVIIIASAGNNNTSTLNYPASYDGVVSVSAVDMNRQKAPYSNYGTAVDVAAPGGDVSVDRNGDGFPDGVLSTLGSESGGRIGFTFSFYQGTSMAAPHVAGVAALMKAVWPQMTPDQFDQALSSGAIVNDLGAPGRDDIYGHGLIDAYKAVVYAKEMAGAAPLPPDVGTLAVTPRSLNFEAQTDTLTLTVSNAAAGSLTGVTATDNASWLSVIPAEVDGNGLGRYTVQVSRAGLSEGVYTGEITFSSSAGVDVKVQVIMQVGGQARVGDAGYHYVLLVDADDMRRVLDQVDVGATNGNYPFSFAKVPPGRYYIIAGTDANNDGYICDVGEACGAYTSLSELTAVTVEGDVGGLNFMTGFDQSFMTSESTNGLGLPGRLPVARMPR